MTSKKFKFLSLHIRFFGYFNHTSTYTGTETAADVNPSNAFAVTLRAKWTANVYNFSYTGSTQTWAVPYDGYYKVELWGAQGSDSDKQKFYLDYISEGALGGYTSGDIYLSHNTIFYLYVGGKGLTMYAHFDADSHTQFNNGTTSSSGSHGGAETDIRTIYSSWNDVDSLRSRVMVAAGGGTVTYDSTSKKIAGAGGGLTGYSGAGSNGATQTSGSYGPYASGSFGIANGGCTGGNGWYGAGGVLCVDGSGGGSSYISGHTGSVGVTSTSSSNPKSGCTTGTTNNACSLTPYINPATGTSYTFTNTLMIDGAGYKWTNTKQGLQQMPNPNGGYYASGVGHSGNGAARITYLETSI